MKKILFFLFVSIASFGQINITFPFEKSVFQRNINNTAKLDIAGNFASFIDKVEAKLTPVSGGVAIDWTTIQTNPQNGIYKGSLDVQGGWYTLEVRGSLNGQVVASSILSRVGIGEVFLIAGQSNAQGLYNSGAVGSTDERVICVNNYSNFTTDASGNLNLKLQNFTEPTLPTFETITANSTIAPMGRSAWCWGKLGDLLTQRLNVPVLFFNVALEGQTVANWKNTADGQNVVSPWNSAYNQGTYPYLSMKTVINYYLNTYGVRSVLWHQGEADSYFNTPPNQYIDDLKFVINKSRTDLGKNIPWVISRVSYYNDLVSTSPIINAQNQVIGNTNSVFSGPNTDAIQVPRPDGVHFSNQGLIDLASAWNTSLDQSFFANAIPVQGTPLIPITATCNPTDIFKPMTYTGLGTYSSYNWSDGGTSPNTSIGIGAAYLKVKDSIGNVSYSHVITNNSPIIPSIPVISISGATSFCSGSTVTLTSNYPQKNTWSTGSNTNAITVGSTNNYSVSHTNVYGCKVASLETPVVVYQTPSTPTTNITGVKSFCISNLATLKALGGSKYLWSVGQTTDSILVNTAGTYSVKAISAQGCESLPSPSVTINYNPIPVKPTITINGNTSFCADQNVALTSSDVDAVSYLWNNGANTKSITINQTGDFSVKTINSYGCASNSSGSIITQANPLPISPIISANSSTTICNGDNVVLKHNSILPVSWSTGIGNAATISVKEQGVYSARSISSFGCFSLISNTIPVIVKPVPPKPTITINGNTSFCADQNVVLTSSDVNAVSYLWNNAATTKSITVTQTGTFTVKTINTDGCSSLAATDISTEQNPLPPTPTVTANGVNILCQGEVATLKYNSVLPVTWSTGAITSTIPVTGTGTYTARVTDVKGCVSLPSTPLTITFRPVPAKPTIKQIGSFTLQADPADATRVYEWKYGSTILPIIKDIIKSNNYGIYTLRAANKYIRPEGEFLCYSEAALFDFNNDPTFSNSLGVYPNPSIGTITIETQQDVKNAKVTLYRVDGAEIFTNTVSNFDERKVFDLGIYGKGTYIIRVKSADFDAAKKIIIE